MRRIAVVSTSRADYSHLYWVLRELEAHPGLQPELIVTAAHLDSRFGRAVDEIRRDGFDVHAAVECLTDSDGDAGMAETIGRGILGLTPVLDRLRPDLMLLIADRHELLTPAAVGLALRIPLAHIEGGEVSEGAIDDAVRNAVTKMAHLHFTPTEAARQRVLALGEEPWRVHRTGAPSLDHLRRSALPDREGVERAIGVRFDADPTVVAYHPLTIAEDTLREADAVFDALSGLDGPIVFCFPNADAGGRALIDRANRFCAGRPHASLHVNLNPVVYWGLLRCAGLMLGNSSSAIMEAPSLALPVVNVGLRQQGRERARNVIDAPATRDAIAGAIARARSPEFRASLRGMLSPYGDGHAAERIVAVLAACPLGETLLLKRAVP